MIPADTRCGLRADLHAEVLDGKVARPVKFQLSSTPVILAAQPGILPM